MNFNNQKSLLDYTYYTGGGDLVYQSNINVRLYKITVICVFYIHKYIIIFIYLPDF